MTLFFVNDNMTCSVRERERDGPRKPNVKVEVWNCIWVRGLNSSPCAAWSASRRGEHQTKLNHTARPAIGGGESQKWFGVRAAPARFLEQMRGVCFIIESRGDSLCLCFCMCVCLCGKAECRYSVICLCCGFCSVILVLSQGKATASVWYLCTELPSCPFVSVSLWVCVKPRKVKRRKGRIFFYLLA